MADVAGGGGDDGRREVLRVGGGELVQLILEVLASAGVAGHRINDHEDDDIDVILKLPGLANDAPKNSVFQPQLPVAALEALLLLRNLCFHSEAKAHVTANPRALDALVAAAGASDAGARAAAADALLALTHNGVDDAFATNSPDSTLLDISDVDGRGGLIGREPSDGLAIGPAWVH